MKLFLPILLLSIFTFTACSVKNDVNSQNTIANQNAKNERVDQTPAQKPTETTGSAETECNICDFDFENYKGDLKKAEIEGLLLALNDEYLAIAIYGQVNKDFDDPRPFSNIERAETRHAENLKELFNTYNLPIPENNWIGNVPKFQSVAKACEASLEAEVANRNLYDRLFDSTTREDILITYKALQRASEENHLPAFKRCGGSGGGSERRGNR